MENNKLDIRPLLPFYKAIEQLKLEYESLEKENMELSNKIKKWNKDEEIQKLKDELRDGYRIPARVMKKIGEAEDKHYDKDTSIVITQTYLDDCVELRCNKCGKILGKWWI